MAMGFFGFLSLLSLLFLGGSIAAGIWLWIRVRRDRRMGDLPTCGQCGYVVRGIGSLACPECGADLREVGIHTARTHGRLTFPAFAILWGLTLILPSCIVSSVVGSMLPQYRQTSDRMGLEARSGALGPAELRVEARHRAGHSGSVSITHGGVTQRSGEWRETLRYPAGGHAVQRVQFTLEATDGVSHSTAFAPGENTRDATRAALEQLVQAGGYDVNDDVVAADVAELADVIAAVRAQGNELRFTRFTRGSGGGSTSTTSPPVSLLLPVLFGPWLLAWLVGLFLFHRTRRRAPPTSSPSLAT